MAAMATVRVLMVSSNQLFGTLLEASSYIPGIYCMKMLPAVIIRGFSSSFTFQSMKPHIPLIKFRKGGITGNNLRATQVAPAPTDSAKARLTAPPKPILEDWQLPRKYQRQPLSDLEIEYINYGGPPVAK